MTESRKEEPLFSPGAILGLSIAAMAAAAILIVTLKWLFGTTIGRTIALIILFLSLPLIVIGSFTADTNSSYLRSNNQSASNVSVTWIRTPMGITQAGCRPNQSEPGIQCWSVMGQLN